MPSAWAAGTAESAPRPTQAESTAVLIALNILLLLVSGFERIAEAMPEL
jgi:hypothetical protein